MIWFALSNVPKDWSKTVLMNCYLSLRLSFKKVKVRNWHHNGPFCSKCSGADGDRVQGAVAHANQVLYSELYPKLHKSLF